MNIIDLEGQNIMKHPGRSKCTRLIRLDEIFTDNVSP